MSKPLVGRVCVVTGATRGIGRGIALQLGEKGAKVYITGRTLDPPKTKVGGSLRETAAEIDARGGQCIPVQCDHANDDEIKRLFKQIERENDGQLDILVNNAYSAVNALFTNLGKKFWEQPVSLWDEVNNVGLRNHYLCAVYAARMMVPRKRGLIVTVSSVGGMRYLFNVSYGTGKAACDRMAADGAFELCKSNVAFVSLWPGATNTETIINMLREQTNNSADLGKNPSDISPKDILEVFETSESTEFPGQCIVELAIDPNIMTKSGQVLFTSDLGLEYGLTDGSGHIPTDMRQVKYILRSAGYVKLAWLIPGFVRIPKWLLMSRFGFTLTSFIKWVVPIGQPT